MSIYKTIVKGTGQDDFVVTTDKISSGMWADGAGSITTFYTSSTQSSSNAPHYLDVYSANPQSDSTAKPQFSIAYGHYNGSGSKGTKGAVGNRASAAIYRQLANILLVPGTEQFQFAEDANTSSTTGANSKPKDIYAISVNRQQLREKMDPGNWELHISGGLGGVHSTIPLKFIDDSGATTDPSVDAGGRVFNIVSGSISTGVASTDTIATAQPGGGYGLFYPDVGILIFNAAVLNTSSSLGTVSGSNVLGGNNTKFFNAIASGSKFQARREEVITSQHYFCRLPNADFNFSANPTFTSGSIGDGTQGSFTVPTFRHNPKTYVTQIGLYNDTNELLAVAKLSKPLLKSFSREAIIKVKLDF